MGSLHNVRMGLVTRNIESLAGWNLKPYLLTLREGGCLEIKSY